MNWIAFVQLHALATFAVLSLMMMLRLAIMLAGRLGRRR